MGPERRHQQLELDAALAEVQRLHNAATTLANAVAQTAHRGEIIGLKDEVKRDFQYKLIFQAALTVVALFILIIYINTKMNNHTEAVDKKFQITHCLLTKTEAQRTGEMGINSLAACRATVR